MSNNVNKALSDPVFSPKRQRARLILVPLKCDEQRENYTLFAKDVDDAVCQKNKPFSTLFVYAGA